jgi:hypothetical protein
MRRSRLLVCLAAALLLCACGSSSASSASSASSSPSSSSGPSTSSCPHTDLLIAVQASVQAEAPQSTVERTISPGKHQPLTCGTTVTAAGPSGRAIAKFGVQGICQLQPFDNQPGSIMSRDPKSDLLTLNTGELSCTVPGPINHPSLVQCPNGSVAIHRDAQLQMFCVPGASFVVSVLRGSAQIIDLQGHPHVVSAGQKLSFDFSNGAFVPGKANISQLTSIFSSLAAESG